MTSSNSDTYRCVAIEARAVLLGTLHAAVISTWETSPRDSWKTLEWNFEGHWVCLYSSRGERTWWNSGKHTKLIYRGCVFFHSVPLPNRWGVGFAYQSPSEILFFLDPYNASLANLEIIFTTCHWFFYHLFLLSRALLCLSLSLFSKQATFYMLAFADFRLALRSKWSCVYNQTNVFPTL